MERLVRLSTFLHLHRQPCRNDITARPSDFEFIRSFSTIRIQPCRTRELLVVQHGADAVALLHELKGLVDGGQRLAVGDELVHLEAAVEVVLDEVGELAAALDAAKGAALPDAARDQLECCDGVR